MYLWYIIDIESSTEKKKQGILYNVLKKKLYKGCLIIMRKTKKKTTLIKVFTFAKIRLHFNIDSRNIKYFNYNYLNCIRAVKNIPFNNLNYQTTFVHN